MIQTFPVPNNVQRLAYQQSQSGARDALLCFLHGLRLIERPKSVNSMLDVGCGAGHFVQLADIIGIKSVGLDICIGRKHVEFQNGSSLWYADLTREVFFHDQEFDLVLCLEVAEHLPESASDQLISTCVNGLANRGILMFSAATPGQGGAGHINEQPHDYWITKLKNAGLILNIDLTDVTRRVWNTVAPATWWYGKNIMIWEKPK